MLDSARSEGKTRTAESDFRQGGGVTDGPVVVDAQQGR